MKNIVKTCLLVTNIISFVFVVLFGVTGIIYEIFGSAGYERMLTKLKIPFSFESIWIFMFISLVALIITYFLRKKLFKTGVIKE